MVELKDLNIERSFKSWNVHSNEIKLWTYKILKERYIYIYNFFTLCYFYHFWSILWIFLNKIFFLEIIEILITSLWKLALWKLAEMFHPKFLKSYLIVSKMRKKYKKKKLGQFSQALLKVKPNNSQAKIENHPTLI